MMPSIIQGVVRFVLGLMARYGIVPAVVGGGLIALVLLSIIFRGGKAPAGGDNGIEGPEERGGARRRR